MLTRLTFILVVFVSGIATGQTNRYVVYFKDKVGNGYSIAQPEAFLSQASISRRAKQQISYTDEDLPITQSYVSKVKATGAKTYFTSRWLNCILVVASTSVASAISQLPEVLKVEYVAPGNRLTGGRISSKYNLKTSSSNQAAILQFQQIGVDQMNSSGVNGEGINVAVFDGGFLGVNTTSAFVQANSRIKNTFNFIDNTKSVFIYDGHGTETFSILAAQTTGFSGGITQANYFLFLTEDVSSEYRIEEYNWLFAAELADSLGIDVISSSLGYSTFDDSSMDYKTSDLTGSKAIVSIAAAKALTKGILVVNSAGNEGASTWRYITPPADVPGILAVGAITSQQVLSSFSSVGPTADGRIKPDVVALGSSTSIINSGGSLITGSGTSFSCPLVTCLVTGLRQAYPNAKVQDLYYAVIKSADQANAADNYKGYGLPNFKGAVNYLQQAALDQPIVISPNPVSSALKIFFKETTEEEVDIKLFNIEGQQLSAVGFVLNWQNNPVEFDLSSLAAGVYIVQIKSASQSLTSRLIKL